MLKKETTGFYCVKKGDNFFTDCQKGANCFLLTVSKKEITGFFTVLKKVITVFY